ncbi:MAG: peptidyl-prolyl cis-trans isomerase [Pseudobdellovibrionaceae bacterium]
MLLRSMRNGFLSAIFLGLLVMGAMGLILSDWNGMFRGGVTATDVAVVDGDPIKIQDFHNRLSNALRSRNIDPKDAYQLGLVDAFLRQDIFERLFKKFAQDTGLAIDDNFVAKRIQALVAPLKKEGMSDKEALALYLKTAQTTEAKLVESLRDDTAAAILQNIFASASYVPEALIADLNAYSGETREADVFFIPRDSIKLDNDPSDDDLRSSYAQTTNSYMLPESRDITLALLNTAALTKDVTIADADISAAYEENKADYDLPETRSLEQAIFPSEDVADKTLALVKSGLPLKEAVKKVTGKTDDYTNAKTYKNGDFPEEISEPLFAGATKEALGPYKTGLGYHLFVIQEIIPAHTQSLDDVRDNIRAALLADKQADRIFEVSGAIEERLDAGERYEDLAKAYPLDVKSVKNLQRDSKDEALAATGAGKAAHMILEQAFAAEASHASTFKELGDGKIYSLRVDTISKSMPKPFDTVKNDVKKAWMADQKRQKNLAAASALSTKLNDGAITLAKVSQKVAHYTQIKRTDAPEGLPLSAAERLMSAEQGKFIVIEVPEKDGVYVGRVSKIDLGKMTADQKNDPQAALMIRQNVSKGTVDMFANWLTSQYEVTINKELLERAYGRQEE